MPLREQIHDINYTIPRIIRELQSIFGWVEIPKYYTIPRIIRELQLNYRQEITK